MKRPSFEQARRVVSTVLIVSWSLAQSHEPNSHQLACQLKKCHSPGALLIMPNSLLHNMLIALAIWFIVNLLSHLCGEHDKCDPRQWRSEFRSSSTVYLPLLKSATTFCTIHFLVIFNRHTHTHTHIYIYIYDICRCLPPNRTWHKVNDTRST